MNESERVILELVQSQIGVFSIDTEGRIWRHKVFTRTGNRRAIFARRADHTGSDGYRSVRVNLFGREYRAQAHRIVWIAARGPIPEGQEPNHKNGIRGDNRPSNLELLTKSGNLKHAYDVLGRCRTSGERNGRHKLTSAQATTIRQRLALGEAKRALAREFSVTPVVIRKIGQGIYWRNEYPRTADAAPGSVAVGGGR
jgi:hypothetical protein